MAARSREAIQKRLRERRRAEKAEQKRLKKLLRRQGAGADGDEQAPADGTEEEREAPEDDSLQGDAPSAGPPSES